ncbi:hypothetical protein [Kribbella sp. NPDC055071]
MRDALWSPASFVGGVVWLGVGIGSALAGFNPFGLILLGVLVVLVLGSLVSQAIRGHRGFCLLGRGLWFGIAVPGLPLRILGAFNS